MESCRKHENWRKIQKYWNASQFIKSYRTSMKFLKIIGNWENWRNIIEITENAWKHDEHIKITKITQKSKKMHGNGHTLACQEVFWQRMRLSWCGDNTKLAIMNKIMMSFVFFLWLLGGFAQSCTKLGDQILTILFNFGLSAGMRGARRCTSFAPMFEQFRWIWENL